MSTEVENLDKDQLKLYYFQATDIWKRFIDLHNSLYEKTCDEYQLLLDSKLDELEVAINDKEEIDFSRTGRMCLEIKNDA